MGTGKSASAVRGTPAQGDLAVSSRFRVFLVIGLAITVAILLAGSSRLYTQEREHLLQTRQNELMAIAELKVGEITGWLEERQGDAGVLMERTDLQSTMASFLDEPGAENRFALLSQFAVLQERYGYGDILVIDLEGDVRLSLSDAAEALHEEARLSVEQAFSTRSPTMTRIHAGADGSPRFGIVAPFFDNANGAPVPIGAIVLWNDADEFLYPLVQSWPTPSETAETLLVTRDGNDVLFLNDLRFHENAALNLRIPIGREDLPAAMALTGKEGLVEGVDYRGHEVMAVLKQVPGTEWDMVAKVDMDEVFAGWSTSAALIAGLTLALLLATMAAGGLIWQRQARQQGYRTALLLERRVAERTAELEESNRELESFAYSVSHDLRSPLRAIDGFSQILTEDYGERLDEEGNRLLDVVRKNAQRMDELISDLLEMSRVGRSEMAISQVDMEALARSVFDEVATDEVRTTFDLVVRPMPAAQGDRTLLRLALTNLITNAIKFTMPSATRRIEVGGYRDAGANVYYVKDTGVGFDPRYAGKLFDVFERLHDQGEFEGTGIGLAIVDRIVRRHGGRARAESGPSGGATFYMELPVRGGAQ